MEQMDKLKTGTTTVGVIAKDAVVLAADRRSTLGYLIASKEAQKIFQIDDYIALSTAGSVADTQRLLRVIKAEINLYKHDNEMISVKGAATLLANILNSSRFYPFIAQFILSGVDKNGPEMYDLDPLGSLIKQEKFTAAGSGSPIAYGVLEDSYKENIDKEEAIKLTLRAVKAAIERDIASGEGIDVAVVDKIEGFRMLGKNEIKKYV